MIATLAPPCAADPDLWFSEHPDDIARAKEICSGCWRLRACQQDIAELGPEFGVWAALTPQERGVKRSATEKHCPGCDKTKPIDAFGGDWSRADGHAQYCKECRSGARSTGGGSEAARAAALQNFQAANAQRSAVFQDRLGLFARLRDIGVSKFAAADQLGLTDRSAYRYETRYQDQRQQEAAA